MLSGMSLLWADTRDVIHDGLGACDSITFWAAVFAAAVWEIIYEKLPKTPCRCDVSVGSKDGYSRFNAHDLDVATASKGLSDPAGAKANLVTIDAVAGGFSGAMSVPEPITVALLAFGGLASAQKRRKK